MPRTRTSRYIKTSPLRRQLTNSAASNHDLPTRTRFSGVCALYVHVAHATLQSAVAAACFSPDNNVALTPLCNPRWQPRVFLPTIMWLSHHSAIRGGIRVSPRCIWGYLHPVAFLRLTTV
jgi:hypothetical protein